MTMENPVPSTHDKRASATSTTKPSSPRCTSCSAFRSDANNPKNIVVCIDGTSNQFGENNTNVVKLFSSIDGQTTQPEQCTYYTGGIGTRPKSLDRLASTVSDKLGMAIAWNVEEIIQEAYNWLSRMYREGDKIYLFGFSRGAYQVRMLAWMIYEVGLLKTLTEKQAATAHDHFQAIRSKKPMCKQDAGKFKNTFSWPNMRVHFIGVWDTVSSVGLIRGNVSLSSSISAAHACHVRHALALDERRVKFMPEYFCEMNSQPQVPKDKENTTDIKEVWFAGSHSDVGGWSSYGRSYHAGNVSLLWMRREATASGLVLLPTDEIWIPEDIDIGVSNSMTPLWLAIEYLPIKHQTCFSGAGEDTRRWHRRQPRPIIPRQKFHASILCANAYRLRETQGEVAMHIVDPKREDLGLDSDIWETGLFDVTVAHSLLNHLCRRKMVEPRYLDGLLFMLRFKEGRESVKKAEQWRDRLKKIIKLKNAVIAPLVKLVALVIYYEVASDTEQLPNGSDFEENVYTTMQECTRVILEPYRQSDAHRVFSLLRYLMKHTILREKILTPDILEQFGSRYIWRLSFWKESFGGATDDLCCFLQCEQTRELLCEKIHSMLRSDHPHCLALTLRVMLALTQDNTRKINIQDARASNGDAAVVKASIEAEDQTKSDSIFSLPVKERLVQLTAGNNRLAGHLAAQILLTLYKEADLDHLDFSNLCVQINLASALISLKSKTNDPVGKQFGGLDPEYEMPLHHAFGFDGEELTGAQKQLVITLTNSVKYGDAPERTTVTRILLKLCETTSIRMHFCANGLLDLFIKQLQHKDSALLAAYALGTYLKYSDVKFSTEDNALLSKRILGMLRMDYFDDAVCSVEGFQIFRNLMEDVDLRHKIQNCDITKILIEKLKKGKPKSVRTGLIYLDVLLSFDPNGPWPGRLVKKSLQFLKDPAWKTQKAGIAILSALARTDYGVKIISGRVSEIIETLMSPFWRDQSPLRMMGPAGALCILVQHEELRKRIRQTQEYNDLRRFHLAKRLVSGADISPWRINTPGRDDVIRTLNLVIKVVDKEVPGNFMLTEDMMLPRISHWNRRMMRLGDRVFGTVIAAPAVLGASMLVAVAMVVGTPIYLSGRAYAVFKQHVANRKNEHALDVLVVGPGNYENCATNGETLGESTESDWES